MSKKHPSVKYREVPGFPAYRVGSDGSVWSRWRRGGHEQRLDVIWRRLKTPINAAGYPCVKLSIIGRRNIVTLVHTLVLTAFVGPRPSGMECCHDPDPTRSNCRLENLRWDTPAKNQADRKKHGTSIEGEKQWCVKLAAAQVIEIRQRRAKGERVKDIAKDYNVNTPAIWKIVGGQRWKHLL
jgi:hypothetical protein